MAFVLLQSHYIMSGLMDGVHTTGRYIRVMAEGSTILSEIWSTASGAGTQYAVPSGGPQLGTEITVGSGTFNDYQYCDGADLVYYTPKITWPYADYHTSVDHPSCAIVVCDLEITGFTTVNESAVGAADGEISLTSTSSNGTVKYSLDPDFDYSTEGTTGDITSLNTGNYIVYAKDAGGCTDQINVFVGIDYTYGVRWRCEYDVVKPVGYVSRIDIEERDYEGEIEETCAGPEPFEFTYNPSDEYQVVPSEATITFRVSRGEDGKFDDIRTGYDRKHVVRKYKGVDAESLELEWVGYLTPEFYTEPYYHEPYDITLKAVDGLGDVRNKAFVELSGEEYFGNMTVIDIIAECLKKLPVQLNIRSCVNIYEENMSSTSADDPLAQAYIKSENFRNKKCGEVITSILKPFTRAQLFQSYGVWWIRTKEQAVNASLPYREFDKNGDYVSNSIIFSRKQLNFPSNTNRFIWTDRSQLLNYTRNYGSFVITHDLGKDNNMIDSGGFELEDIDLSTEFFRDWQLFPAQTNVISGLEYVDSENSKGAFVFQWGAGGTNQANNILQTVPMPVDFSGNVFQTKLTNFKLKFQVYASPAYPVKHIWIGWKFRFTDTDTGDFWDWYAPPSALSSFPDVNEERINDIYVSSFNSWQTYEFYNFRAPGDIDAVNFNVQVSFYFHNHQGRDFSSLANLAAAVTVGMDEGKKYYVVHDGHTYCYRLERNTDAEDSPNTVEPDDYNSVTNPVKWIKETEYNIDGLVPILDRIMIDNVKISLFTISPNLLTPGTSLIDPPETVIYEETITPENEMVFTDEVKTGDVPDVVGYNYIYNGFFKLADDTPTRNWARAGVTESRYLLDIYLSHLVAQGGQSLRLLSGSGIADIQLGFINSLQDQIDDRRYRFVRFTLQDKSGVYDIEMEETLVGADGESPPDIEAITFDSTFYTFDMLTETFDEG